MDSHGCCRAKKDLIAREHGRRPPITSSVPQHGGCFVALEGGEGAGKSTQAERLAEHLRGLGHEVLVTREPGDTPVGQQIRRLLLDPTVEITDKAEALLYAADRAEHVTRVVRPALERGAVVVTDRYVDSSVAYQGYGRGLSPEAVLDISRWATSALLPDVTVLLDLPVDEGMRRARARGRLSGAETDRIEAEAREFHERIRDGFLRLAGRDPARYTLVDAARSPDEVAAAVRQAVEPRLPTPPSGPPSPSAPENSPVSA